MNLNIYSDLTTFQNTIKNRGFKRTFEMIGNRIYCKETSLTYSQSEIQIVEYKRFGKIGGRKKPRIVILIQCNDNEKGYINASLLGREGNNLLNFMDKVRIQPRSTHS